MSDSPHLKGIPLGVSSSTRDVFKIPHWLTIDHPQWCTNINLLFGLIRMSAQRITTAILYRTSKLVDSSNRIHQHGILPPNSNGNQPLGSCKIPLLRVPAAVLIHSVRIKSKVLSPPNQYGGMSIRFYGMGVLAVASP
jgi:hypothetical protein